MQVDLTAERVARNESWFRNATDELSVDPDAIPFICECSDPTCAAITKLSLVEYETIRSREERFVAAPGHEACVVNGQEVARIAKRYEHFTLMERVETAGELGVKVDPPTEAAGRVAVRRLRWKPLPSWLRHSRSQKRLTRA